MSYVFKSDRIVKSALENVFQRFKKPQKIISFILRILNLVFKKNLKN